MSTSIASLANPVTDDAILSAFGNATMREEAFTWLVNRDQQKIYWLIRRMVIDHDDANDLVQETFIRAWKHLSGFRGETQLIFWLYRIASNITLSFLEKKKRKGLLPLAHASDELVAKLHTGKYINGSAIELALQEAILILPHRQRLVFQLRYYDEMPYDAMAAMLETSAGALKASYHIAVKKVEQYLLNHS